MITRSLLIFSVLLCVCSFPVPVREDLFEGDIAGIILPRGATTDDVRRAVASKNGAVSPALRWPGAIMYYEISPSFTPFQREKIINATKEFNTKTESFRLVERIDATHYVSIQRGGVNSGCWSYVGRIGGRQILNLETQDVPGQPHCIHHGIIVHELMHAAGFWHEQSRMDRDDHVDINWANISPDRHHNFAKYNNWTVTAFGEPYDYGSLMHYGRFDFATDRRLWSIRPKEPLQDTPIGQRVGLSDSDIRRINAMYPKP